VEENKPRAGRGLLDRLAAVERPAGAGEDPTHAIKSHLQVLLNTRRGEALAAPEFGVVDFTDLVYLPLAGQALQHSLRATIEQYEPRLKGVHVRQILDDNDPLKLKFEIIAQVANRHSRETLRFHTEVLPGGQFKVNPAAG
jgi:type VI secretion system protein